MNDDIKIGIGEEGETAREFMEAWRRAECDEAPERPVEHLYFPDLNTLLRALTPRGMALLKRLHAIGPVSVRALSKELARDYKSASKATMETTSWRPSPLSGAMSHRNFQK